MKKIGNIYINAIYIVLLILLFTCCSGDNKNEGKNPSWKFVVTGDCRSGSKGSGVNEDILSKIAEAISHENIDFVLFNGDVCYGHADRKGLGDSAALRRLEKELKVYLKTMQPVYSKGIPVYNIRGNHETTQRNPDHPGHRDHRPVWHETKKIWDKVFSGKYAALGNGPAEEENVTFSFTHKNALIVGMDLYSTPVPGVQPNADGSIPYWAFHHVNQPWLDEQLQVNEKPHVFTFAHEPAFKVSHTDCLHGNSSIGIDYSEDRDDFWRSIARAGARVYFCGHDHGYAHARIDEKDGNVYNDLHQFVVGTAGAGKDIRPVYDGYNGAYHPVGVASERSYGYLLAEIQGDDVMLTYKRMVDEVHGTFEIADVFQYSLDEISSVKPLPRAFAHNDYEHENPLFDALEHGFTVIEADVHLIDGELYVTHDPPVSLDSVSTLKELYLDPLSKHIDDNEERVYPGYNSPVYLMIDIKTEGKPTYEVLRRQLMDYTDILSSISDIKTIPKPIRVFVSGNRPVQAIKKDTLQLVGVDGRLPDLEKGYCPEFMPLISQSISDLVDWNGIDTISSEEFNILSTVSQKVHRQGKKFRLWGIPDNEYAWKILLDAGIDYVCADDLLKAKLFLLNQYNKDI